MGENRIASLDGLRGVAAFVVLVSHIMLTFPVIAAAYCPVAKRALERRLTQWLGLISFSLYLTHEPIVIALAFLFGSGGSWLVALTAVPVALVVGWMFYRLIESPSHRLSQRVGRMARKPELARV